MYPESTRAGQRGAGLPVAIFIITVLALLVAGMAQLQESGSKAISLQIQSQRAFLAAESGAQVGIAETLAGEDRSALTSPKTFTGSGLNTCRAVVSCSAVSADIEGNSDPETVFTLTSIGQCGSGPDRAVRTVEVRFR